MDDFEAFEDFTGDGTTAEVNEDGDYVLVTVERNGHSESIALDARDARRMARVLNAYAAGL